VSERPLPPIPAYSRGPPVSAPSVKRSPKITAIASACSDNALASARRPAPRARAIADEMPPPIAPADIICISIITGKTRATPASAAVPSLPTK